MTDRALAVAPTPTVDRLRTLGALADRITDAHANLDELVEARNRLVIELRTAGVSTGKPSRYAGLSRQRIHQLTHTQPTTEEVTP